jgi:ribonuclease BN (tRNA processing enzyme)
LIFDLAIGNLQFSPINFSNQVESGQMRLRLSTPGNRPIHLFVTGKFPAVLVVLLSLSAVFVQAQTEKPGLPRTQVVMLGSGNPRPDPERSGPAVAIVVNDTAYLVDCGPGIVRRAAAAEKNGVAALATKNLKTVFITHLHSDHTLGYPDLIFSPWVIGRTDSVNAYGPRGLTSMTADIEKAWKKDIYVRTHGLEQANHTGYKVVVHEIKPGVVYRDANVTVTAFAVKHGTWDQAFGYKFQTADRRIVVAGDTAPTDAVVQACDGCDVLLHEVYNPHGEELKEEHWKEYFATFHTSPEGLGDIAKRAHPKLLLLYHEILEKLPEEDLLEQVKKYYSGNFVAAKDLGVY